MGTLSTLWRAAFPKPEPERPRPDYDKIARLERALGLVEGRGSHIDNTPELVRFADGSWRWANGSKGFDAQGNATIWSDYE